MNAKINLIPLVAFGLILRWVWRENEKLASNMSFGAHTAALGFLILDALMHQSLGNTLFVLITTLVILLISFAKKNGRWFAVSGASFLGLTFYVTLWQSGMVGISACGRHNPHRGCFRQRIPEKQWHISQRQVPNFQEPLEQIINKKLEIRDKKYCRATNSSYLFYLLSVIVTLLQNSIENETLKILFSGSSL